MKKLIVLLALLLSTPAFAVDNSVIVTPGVGVTMRSKDVGAGVESMIHILGDTTGNPIYGTAGTANANILSVQGIAAMTPFLVTATQSGTWNITNISGTVSLPTGASTSANQGTTADVPCTVPTSATACSEIAIAKAIANAAAAAVPTGANVIGQVGQVSQYPFGAVPITASATGTTAATTATLAASASIKTYICGYSIRANATANTNVTDTVTGVVTGTMSSALWVPANTAGLGVDEQIFSPCIPSSAINTAVAVVSGAPGTGGVVTVKAWGYQL